MRKIYLFAFSMLAYSATNAQTTLIDDNFESHPVGYFYGGMWKNWHLNEAEENLSIIVTTDQAASGTKSGLIGVSDGSGGQDALLVMPGTYNNGVTIAEWKMYIPDTAIAYYNLQETTTPGTSWGYECYTNFYTNVLSNGDSLQGKMVWTHVVDSTRYIYAYAAVPFNEWFTLRQVIDLDNDEVEFFINNNPATAPGGNAWPGTLRSFGGFNFYSAPTEDSITTMENTYYIDDVLITTTGVLSAGKLTAPKFNVSIYPNPAEAILNIEAEEKVLALEIHNLAGQKVYTTMPNSNKIAVDVSNLAAGVYSVTLKANNKTVIKKITVK